MKLHSPQFEKSLRRRIKGTIRGSPQLQKELRATNKFRKHYHSNLLLRALVPVFLGYFIWRISDVDNHPVSAMAFISLWAAHATLIQAINLWSCLFKSTDLAVLGSLPMDESTIFRWQLQKFFRGTIYSLVDLAAAFGTLAWLLDFSISQWFVAAAICFLTWSVMLSLAVLCTSHVEARKYRAIPGFVYMAVAILFVTGKTYGLERILSWFDRQASSINLLLPTGWAVSLFELLLPKPFWMVLLLLIPVAAILSTLPDSIRRLRKAYVFRERIREDPSALLPTAVPAANGVDGYSNQDKIEAGSRVGLTEITDIIRSRQFLAVPEWSGLGWCEKLLWRWFSPRERALSEFIFPNGMSIASGWTKSFQILGFFAVVGFILGMVTPVAKGAVIGIGLFLSFVILMTLIYDTGRAFEPHFISGFQIPMYTNFAAGTQELANILFKFTAVQAPFLLTWSVLCGVLLTHLNSLPVPDGIMYGLRGSCLLFAGRFILMVYGFSSGTNDTKKLGSRNLLLILVIVILGLLFLALGAMGLVWPMVPGLAWLLTALAVLDAYIFFRAYLWFYHELF